MAGKVVDVDAPPTAIPPFTTTIAVPLHCQSCIDDVSRALSRVRGILDVTASLSTQTISIHGTAAPSALLSALQSTGRPAILRGSGAPDSAAVAILETYAGTHGLPRRASVLASAEKDPNEQQPENDVRLQEKAAREDETTKGNHTETKSTPVRGLARLIQVSPTHSLIDIGVTSLPEGLWRARLRCAGDVSRGLAGMGDIWDARKSGNSKSLDHATGELGDLRVGRDGRGTVVLIQEMAVRDVVGRGFSLEMIAELGTEKDTGSGRDGGRGKFMRKESENGHPKEEARQDVAADGAVDGKGDEMSPVVMGVVARSAGVWENEKTVCACSGKTVWEERDEQIERGML